jgi:hypothetical protein
MAFLSAHQRPKKDQVFQTLAFNQNIAFFYYPDEDCEQGSDQIP